MLGIEALQNHLIDGFLLIWKLLMMIIQMVIKYYTKYTY